MGILVMWALTTGLPKCLEKGIERNGIICVEEENNEKFSKDE